MYYVNPVFERPRFPALLGDTSQTPVQVDSADVLSLGQSLRDAQARISNLFQAMQQSPELAAAIGRDLTAQQQALGDLTAKYVGVYTAIFGQAPVGLGNPILIAAAVAVILAYVTAQLFLWHQKQDVLEKQAAAAQLAEQNRGSIIDMAKQAQASAAAKAAAGDAAGAATDQAAALQMLTDAGIPGSAPPPPPPPGTSFSDWIKANWLPVAGVAAAILITDQYMQRR